ncbi:MAG: hypothetical protein U0X73_07025 [Thermoanaerobaculia bacterium]
MGFRSPPLLLLLFVTPALVAEAPTSAPAAACLTNGQVEDILQVDGFEYLAGRFTKVRPPGASPGDPAEVDRLWFAACDAATGAVAAWDPQVFCDGTLYNCANARGQTLALAADRASIYLGGKFRAVRGVARKHAARVTLAGATLLPWAPEANDRVQRIAVAPDGGRVYVAGNFTSIGGCAPAPCHAYLAATDPASGALLPGFDPQISTADASFVTVLALAFSAGGGTLYFGGQFDTVGALARSSIAAVDAATGQSVTAFAPRLSDPNPEDPYVQVHDIRSDGHWIYLCGDWWITGDLGGQQDQRNVNRFDPSTGDVDPGFWIATDGGVQACDLDLDLGLLFVGGHFDCVREYQDGLPVDPDAAQCGTDPLFHGTVQHDLFALALADGSLSAWNPDTGGLAGTWAVRVAGGRLAIGGELVWPRLGPPTHVDLLSFDVPLFADGFESGDRTRWSSFTP